MTGIGMANWDKQLPLFQLAPAGDTKAIEHVKQAIAGGKHWYIALLEAVGLWSSAEETNNGRVHCYLIDGEAFDWLELAERLCETVDGSLSDNEKLALLFHCTSFLDTAFDRAGTSILLHLIASTFSLLVAGDL